MLRSFGQPEEARIERVALTALSSRIREDAMGDLPSSTTENAILIGLFAGFITGFVSSFLVWLLLTRIMVPRIRFSQAISKMPISRTKEDKSGIRYRFKIENAGRRDAIDVEIIARLSVRGRRSKTWNYLYIPLSPDGDNSYRIPRLLPARKNKAGRRKIMFLYTNSRDTLRDWSAFPKELRIKSRTKRLLLEELMRAGDKSKIEIHAFAYDAFSGARKLFDSKAYTLDDIRGGPFGRRSLELADSTKVAKE